MQALRLFLLVVNKCLVTKVKIVFNLICVSNLLLGKIFLLFTTRIKTVSSMNKKIIKKYRPFHKSETSINPKSITIHQKLGKINFVQMNLTRINSQFFRTHWFSLNKVSRSSKNFRKIKYSMNFTFDEFFQNPLFLIYGNKNALFKGSRHGGVLQISFLENFAKFTRKQLCQSVFLLKLQAVTLQLY